MASWNSSIIATLLLYMEKLAINVWLCVFLHIEKDQKQYIYLVMIYEQHIKKFWKDVFDTHDAWQLLSS
jgi:hypothetical protein